MRKFNILAHILLAMTMFFWSAPNFALAQSGTPNPTPAPSTAAQNLPQYTGHGAEQSIKDFLCTPTGSGSDLQTCVNRLYRFAIAIGGFLLVFLLALAGYYYILGSETGKQKAKGIISAGIAGMVIILTSYLLLNQINPALTKFRPIQPPIFTGGRLPSCADVNYTSNCTLDSGQVYSPPGGGGGSSGTANGCKVCQNGLGSAAMLRSTCMGANADVGAYVAAEESSCGANLVSGSDICADGNPVSFGIFQINITAHKLSGLNCPAAFANGPYTRDNHNCRVIDQGLYTSCKRAALDTTTNINYACKILADKGAGRHWYPTWGGASCVHRNGDIDIVK